MVPNGKVLEGKSEGLWFYLTEKKTIPIIKRNKFSVWITFIHLEQKNFNGIKKYVKIKIFLVPLFLLKKLKY